MEDAALSAFSVFFIQTPSFLCYQRKMADSKGKGNAQSLFWVTPTRPNASATDRIRRNY
jgi:hypothetical protein